MKNEKFSDEVHNAGPRGDRGGLHDDGNGDWVHTFRWEIFSARVQADPKGLEIDRPGEMYALGVMHDEGVGVGVDERRAYEWYKRAAKRGHAESMNRLGILCLRGRGVPLNATASLAWFRLAAAKGVPHGNQ